MTRVHMDFETRSRCNLGKAGVVKYAADPSTEVLCLSYKIGGEPVGRWAGHGPPPPDLAKVLQYADTTYHAYNAPFEISLWELMVERHGWPAINLEQWRCTMARCQYANIGPDLAGAGQALLGGDEGKDAEGRKVMLELCKPDNKGNYVEDPEKFARLMLYCDRDVQTEYELHNRTPSWPRSEYRAWLRNHKENRRGIPVDVDYCRGAVKIIDEAHQEAADMVRVLTGGEITKGTQRAAILKFAQWHGVNIDNTQEDTLKKALKAKDMHPHARLALELIQSVSSAAASKYHRTLEMESNGRIHDQIQYHSASTGRFSGRGIQVHNFKRGSGLDEELVRMATAQDSRGIRENYPGSPVKTLGDNARAIIKAPEGKTFVLADYGQIEARVLHWLAFDKDQLQAFRVQDSGTGPDVYQVAAAAFYGIPASQVGKGEKRNAGKAIVLGSGYGMGAVRFLDYALNTYGVKLSPHQAAECIAMYRRKNKKVVELWGKYENAALKAAGGAGPQTVGHVKFRMDGQWMAVDLPSGRALRYHSPSIGDGRFGNKEFRYVRRGKSLGIWGGTWAENIDQAISRDVLVDAMDKVSRCGINIPFHVHDEMVCEVDIAAADEVVDMVRQIMVHDPPEWAEGLPLFTEPEATPRFKK